MIIDFTCRAPVCLVSSECSLIVPVGDQLYVQVLVSYAANRVEFSASFRCGEKSHFLMYLMKL